MGIDMVIGTSGGAINALITAAEVTKDKDKRDNLAATWQSFGQSEILKPSNFVRRLLGLALGLILSLSVYCAVSIFRLIQWLRNSDTRKERINARGSRFRFWGKVRSQLARLTSPERVGIILLVLALLSYLAGLIQVTLAFGTMGWSTWWNIAGKLSAGQPSHYSFVASACVSIRC
jgi:hypothetical protein